MGATAAFQLAVDSLMRKRNDSSQVSNFSVFLFLSEEKTLMQEV